MKTTHPHHIYPVDIKILLNNETSEKRTTIVIETTKTR